MSLDECEAIIDSYNNSYINSWEMTRYIAYVVAACQTEAIKKPSDLIKFPWETEKNTDTDSENKMPMTKEEILLAEQEMLQWLAKQ